METEKDPCADGLTAACFRARPAWAKKMFAYNLLHIFLPMQLSKNLPKGLEPAIVDRGKFGYPGDAQHNPGPGGGGPPHRPPGGIPKPSIGITAALTFEEGEDNLVLALIDQTNGFGYFATDQNPTKIIKIDLSDFTRVGALELNAGEETPYTGAIDEINGFAYFGCYTTQGKIVKVNLSDFTRVGVISLSHTPSKPGSMVIDTTNGFLYVGTESVDNLVYKINLTTFAEVAHTGTSIENANLIGACIDIPRQKAFFNCCHTPGAISRLDLATFKEDLLLNFETGEDGPTNVFIDQPKNEIYVVFPTLTGLIIKLRGTTLTRLKTLTTGSPLIWYGSGAIAPAKGFLYAAAMTNPGTLIKAKLANLYKYGWLTLDEGQDTPMSAIMDTTNDYVYFGCYTEPGIVVKLR